MSDVELRDARGEWQPEELPQPSPLFRWPPRPLAILKYLFGPQGLLFPYNAVYLALAVVSWLFFTPSLDRTAAFGIDWILLIYLRNAGLMILVFGSMHLRLYVRRAQGTRYKYSDTWLAVHDKWFGSFHDGSGAGS